MSRNRNRHAVYVGPGVRTICPLCGAFYVPVACYHAWCSKCNEARRRYGQSWGSTALEIEARRNPPGR